MIGTLWHSKGNSFGGKYDHIQQFSSLSTLPIHFAHPSNSLMAMEMEETLNL